MYTETVTNGTETKLKLKLPGVKLVMVLKEVKALLLNKYYHKSLHFKEL